MLISPDRASIRLMGTRFVIDSYILDQLLYPNVGTADEPRMLPSALDLAAAFGSDFAYGVLAADGRDRLRELRRAARGDAGGGRRPARRRTGARPSTTRGSTRSSRCSSPHGEAYPDFMRTEAWAAKAHQAGLGSYAELKHDTILYTKQAVAEGGDGLPIPPRRNWVEPEPVAFAPPRGGGRPDARAASTSGAC